jgi:hypothetical protein
MLPCFTANCHYGHSARLFFDGTNQVESILGGSLVVSLGLAVLLNTINECPRKRAAEARKRDESNMRQPFA